MWTKFHFTGAFSIISDNFLVFIRKWHLSRSTVPSLVQPFRWPYSISILLQINPRLAPVVLILPPVPVCVLMQWLF